MLGKIYKITNLVNSKVYIGQTTKTLKERFQKHCWGTSNRDHYHLNMAIKLAIKKYGKENFTIELIEEVDIQKLDEREIYWINYYDSYYNGYNCTKGGLNGATRPTKLTEEEENNIIELRLSGTSIKEIYSIYNIDKTTVYNIFKRHNLCLSRPPLVKRITKELLLEALQYNNSCIAIAKYLNVGYRSVLKLLEYYNIEYNFSKSVRTLTSNVEG